MVKIYPDSPTNVLQIAADALIPHLLLQTNILKLNSYDCLKGLKILESVQSSSFSNPSPGCNPV